MADTPRLLTRTKLRTYLGSIAWHLVLDRIETGKLPRPMWKTDPSDPKAVWDRVAVDRALDAESAIPASIEAQEKMLDRALGLA